MSQSIVSYIHKSLLTNNKLTTDIIYIDFLKAFYSVSHSKLLIKLEGYGIRGDLLAWLKASLSNRTQVVNVEDRFSDIVFITSDVPTGQCFGSHLVLAIYK